jgi:hypothetical protein
MDFYKIKKVSQPSNLKINLFPHQLASIYNMEKFESENIIEKDNYVIETKIGINADISGYGKTLSMIGLIVRDKMEWDLEKPFTFTKILSDSNSLIKRYYTCRFEKLPSNLILIPDETILDQWERELKYTSLTYKKILSAKDIEDLNEINCDIIFIISSMYNILINKFKDYAWKRFIFDDPTLKVIKRMKDVYANFYWFVTSKPYYILNKYLNVKGFINTLLCPQKNTVDFENLFEDIIVRNDTEFIKESFIMPKINKYYYDEYFDAKNTIEDFKNPVIKKFLNHNRFTDIILSLGIKKAEDNLLKVLKNKDENKCSICLDELNIPVLEKNCNNLFCLKCFILWIYKNSSCALCRNTIDINSINYIDDYEFQNNIMSKKEKILKIIKETEDMKMFLFSNNIDNFLNIFELLKKHNIEYLECSKNFKKNMDLFKSDKDKKIIFVSQQNSSFTGIYIPDITDIIFFEKINTFDENEIISIVNRIGRLKVLNLHYF